MKYQILQKDRSKYISLVILNEIIQYQHYFPVALTGDDVYLDAYLKGMFEKNLLCIAKGSYVPTEAGRNEIVNLYDKYTDYLKMYDIFCAVDLSTGEFAFNSMANYGDGDIEEQKWQNFLNQDRFSDVRVDVADFKGLNPTEIVFMAFLQEGRFTCSEQGWQNALTADSLWAEIEDICNTAVSREYLTDQGVIEDVIAKGVKSALALIKLADDANAQSDIEGEDEEVVEETTTTTEYYVEPVIMPYYGYSYWDPYFYNPFYVSPLWLDPVFIW